MHSLANNLPGFANPGETPAPPPGVLLADYFQRLPGYSTRRTAGTRDWLIFFTVGGCGRCRLAGRTLLVRAGDVTLFTPGTPQDYATDGDNEPWRFYWAHFIPRASWRDWLVLPEFHMGLLAFTLTSPEAVKRIEATFQRMVRENAERRVYQEDLAQNALEEALILIAQQQYRRPDRSIDPRVGAIQDYLEQHFPQPVRLKEIAGLVSLSPWRVSHLYKSQTGQTVTEALTQLRLRQAARLLVYTSRTVAEIAGDVGFVSSFYFSRVFKKVYGSSPSEYRKENVKTVKDLRKNHP